LFLESPLPKSQRVTKRIQEMRKIESMHIQVSSFGAPELGNARDDGTWYRVGAIFSIDCILFVIL